MNFASLIASFATGTYTVTRTARGSITKGKIEAGTTSTLNITASYSPTSPADLMRLPEGRRTTATAALFTTTELFDGGQGAAYEADKVSIGGETYELNFADNWIDPTSRTVGYRCVLSVVR